MITVMNDFSYQEWCPPCPRDETEGELSFLLDELERTEVYLHSNSCASDEVSECEAEIQFLTARIDALDKST